jgi:hypothetical protein
MTITITLFFLITNLQEDAEAATRMPRRTSLITIVNHAKDGLKHPADFPEEVKSLKECVNTENNEVRVD